MSWTPDLAVYEISIGLPNATAGHTREKRMGYATPHLGLCEEIQGSGRWHLTHLPSGWKILTCEAPNATDLFPLMASLESELDLGFGRFGKLPHKSDFLPMRPLIEKFGDFGVIGGLNTLALKRRRAA